MTRNEFTKPRSNTYRLAAVTLSMILIGFTAVPASAVQDVSVEHSMSVHVRVSTSASGCNNTHGPTITIEGELSLGEVDAQIIFKNNKKGTHTATVEATAKVVVVPKGEIISFPKQPVRGGVGGNPFIFIQLVDKDGKAITDEFFLGRCVQGIMPDFSADFFIPSSVTAQVSAESCSNKGSSVTLTGEVALTGINANLIFRNNDNPVGGPHQHDEEAIVNVTLLQDGEKIEIPKQPPLGGAGGNPIISVAFQDENGEMIGNEFVLGRCNKI